MTRVLVADDDPDIKELVAYRLERAGYDVITADDGLGALALAVEQRPDLAVLDVMMPGLDGLAVTREMREHEATARTPIILLTARVQDADVARGLAAGADDYLTKPFSPHELRERVAAVLGADRVSA